MTAKKNETAREARDTKEARKIEGEKDKREESHAATLEETPEQPLGTDDPTDFEPIDLAPAASGDMDHLNPGVPGDLPNELPARVPTEHTVHAIGGGIGPIGEKAHYSQVNAAREAPRSQK
jgi:hypothetical protein